MQFIQEQSYFDKIKSLDFLMIFVILTIGLISIFAMYSTEGGKLGYHTSSHVIRFGVFFFSIFNTIIYACKILVFYKLFILFFNIINVGMGNIFRNNSLRFPKMD